MRPRYLLWIPIISAQILSTVFAVWLKLRVASGFQPMPLVGPNRQRTLPGPLFSRPTKRSF